MKKLVFAFLALLSFTASCKSITSNTKIKPQDSFILGKNQHGPFQVKLKNVSKNELMVYRAPINGGTHSPEIVRPNEQTTVKVESDTALVIENKSSEAASVDLYITGDTGLSMGYKN